MTTLNISLPDNMKTCRRDQERLQANREQDTRKWQLIQEIARKHLQQRLAEPPPDEFADMSEAEVMQMVREEIQAYRQGKA